ncbi:MAG: hypothetical protein Q8Q39_04415 [bacterium]|nr:hypothetical protein [bacterium]
MYSPFAHLFTIETPETFPSPPSPPHGRRRWLAAGSIAAAVIGIILIVLWISASRKFQGDPALQQLELLRQEMQQFEETELNDSLEAEIADINTAFGLDVENANTE